MPPRPKVGQIVRLLSLHYPAASCSLVFRNAYELLIATILSAQCTDRRVNQITPEFFARYPDPYAVSAAAVDDIKEKIRTAGFFNHKARHIHACCRQLVVLHHGEVPADMEQLLALPGVGRKTANVIRGVWFHFPCVVVDTHVTRIARRLGLTLASSATQIEQDLMQLLPQASWISFAHQVIQHGRTVCLARKPRCENCPLRKWCDFYRKQK
jgi:endonuclease-3